MRQKLSTVAYNPLLPPLLTYGPKHKKLQIRCGKCMKILIDFAKNRTDESRIDQIMGKTECSAKESKLVFFIAYSAYSPTENSIF